MEDDVPLTMACDSLKYQLCAARWAAELVNPDQDTIYTTIDRLYTELQSKSLPTILQEEGVLQAIPEEKLEAFMTSIPDQSRLVSSTVN